jgi:uncharacterized Zn finger protein (UPF0148 family)
MNQLVFDTSINTENVANLLEEGYQLLCPKCKEVLTISYHTDSETKEKSPSLISCPTSQDHFVILFEHSDAHENMRKLFAEMREEREHLNSSKQITKAK